MKRQECEIMTIKANKNEENLQVGTSRRKVMVVKETKRIEEKRNLKLEQILQF